MNWPWSELGLPGPADLSAVRRAYAERLKTTHPEEDPEGFQRLHEAYQQARRMARKGGGSAGPQAQEAPPPRQTGTEAETSALDELFGRPQAPPPEAEEEGRDLDRIFLQEARRLAEERERQSAERRERFFAKYSPASEEEAQRLEVRFARIEAALTVIEELSDGHAPLREWVLFLHSGVYFSVKGDEDFVAALLEFLRRTPDLEGPVKHEMAQAFGLRGRDVPPVWQCLVEPLTGEAYRPEPVPEPAPVVKRPLHKRWSVRIAVVLLLLLAGVPLAVRQIKELREAPGREARAQMCQYLEEDLGRPMEPFGDGDGWENVYAPWDQPELTFMAWPDGQRDMAAGRRGYTTNYGNVMLTEALRDLAAQQSAWELKELDKGGVPGVFGGSPGGYLLQVPLWDQEEGVAALGALMELLEAERWFQVCRPEYTLQLGAFGLVYFTHTSDTPFNGGYLLDYYQNEAGPSFCAYLVEESGLARQDFGGAAYRLEAQGAIELDGQSCFLVSGVAEETGETVRQYIFDGMYLVSFPADRFSPDLKRYQLCNGDRAQSSWADLPPFIQIVRK